MAVLTTFGPDFPVPTAPRAAISGLGRDYVFIQSSEIADASEHLPYHAVDVHSITGAR
jgi:hypothetical protein